MSVWIALLRAVNVGGTGKISMADLRRLCEDCGFAKVRTYISSGNVIFESRDGERDIKARLETALRDYTGKGAGVLVRSRDEMARVLENSPFKDEPSNRTVAIFLDLPPAADTIDCAKGIASERLALGRREIYVAYGQSMAHSKLRVPAARAGTARNMNTITKLVEIASNDGARSP